MIKTLIICIGLIGLPHFAAAQSVEDQVVTQLQEQGFAEIEVHKTFLGRLRFTAESELFYRELVINPQTGEVLRDYIRDLKDDDNDDRDPIPRIMNPNRTPSEAYDDDDGGSNDDDNSNDDEHASDEDDEDDDDDDDDDD